MQKVSGVAVFLLLALLSLPALAQEVPTLHQDGLENYKMGKTPPAKSEFPGLTHTTVVKTESAEGETYKTTYLKFFLQGEYLGKARLDDQGKIDEIVVVSPKVGHDNGYRVGQEYLEAARSFPMGEVIYTYVSDSLFTSSPQLEGLQLFLDKKDYRGKAALEGEYQKIDESDLAASAKITKMRLFSY